MTIRPKYPKEEESQLEELIVAESDEFKMSSSQMNLSNSEASIYVNKIFDVSVLMICYFSRRLNLGTANRVFLFVHFIANNKKNKSQTRFKMNNEEF